MKHTDVDSPLDQLAESSFISCRSRILCAQHILQDLGSILTFLRICNPLDQEDFFKRMLLRPLKDGDPAGAELLRVRYIPYFARRPEADRCQGVDEPHLHPANEGGKWRVELVSAMADSCILDARQGRQAPCPSATG